MQFRQAVCPALWAYGLPRRSGSQDAFLAVGWLLFYGVVWPVAGFEPFAILSRFALAD